MVVQQLVNMEAILTEELKSGYRVLLGTYETVNVRLSDAGFIEEMEHGSKDVVEVVFDPGNEYSLIRLGSYTFEREKPSFEEVQQTVWKHHRDIFKGAISA